ncbi:MULTISPECIES: TIGR01459 family HAD-type hydrolase [Rhodomicrobium]|uniref:TIGR01459 family HAD-type hydrolase n=1 Tax=Rhodomicrobium TaxID=1068 RepID=UPI000B4AB021|nr:MULTISPECIES: TIGR01459 family HAD-type hydrolase [Rhodomicrobium]
MSIETPSIPVLESIACFSRRYDAWLVDIWGVLHNGLRPFASAVEACRLFREGGGVVVLISNAPRPRETVAEQLLEVGVPADCYDGIATSGDVTRTLMAEKAGQTLFHIGPARDLPIFDDLGVSLGGVAESAAVVCSGLYDDETETAADYADLLAECLARKLPMICANPDIKVERGDRLIYCAGAIAKAYEEIGGEVIYAGKPYKPIYDLAMALVSELRGADLPKHRILAIGDGLHTDIAGAVAQNIDSVFVASGVHLAGGREEGVEAAQIARLFEGSKSRPVAALSQLIW